MDSVDVIIGQHVFRARFQDQLAPRTCSMFRDLLPWREKIIHVRWSGECCWVPLGNFELGVEQENATNLPAPGEFLFYPGGVSEAELLLAYGSGRFACASGPLAGNPVLQITEGLASLRQMGEEVLWHGVRDLLIRRAEQ